MSLDSDFTVYLANRKIRSESYIKCNLLKYVKKMKIKYLSPFDTPRVILNVISLRFWRIWSIYTWRNAGMIRTSSDISNKLHLHKPQPLGKFTTARIFNWRTVTQCNCQWGKSLPITRLNFAANCRDVNWRTTYG